jgi:BON domain-containing protein
MTTSRRVSEGPSGARSGCAVSATRAEVARALTSSDGEPEFPTFARSGAGPAARGALGRLSHDEQRQQDVCAALLRIPGLDASGIVVGAFEHGWVTLLGRVSTRRQRQLAVQVARRNAGGSAVRCLLELVEEGALKAELAVARRAGGPLAGKEPCSCAPGGAGGIPESSGGHSLTEWSGTCSCAATRRHHG